MHVELERQVARFLGKEDCVVFNMGYGTNATTIPALCSAVSLKFAQDLSFVGLGVSVASFMRLLVGVRLWCATVKLVPLVFARARAYSRISHHYVGRPTAAVFNKLQSPGLSIVHGFLSAACPSPQHIRGPHPLHPGHQPSP